jgi:hypothetical protein
VEEDALWEVEEDGVELRWPTWEVATDARVGPTGEDNAPREVEEDARGSADATMEGRVGAAEEEGANIAGGVGSEWIGEGERRSGGRIRWREEGDDMWVPCVSVCLLGFEG